MTDISQAPGQRSRQLPQRRRWRWRVEFGLPLFVAFLLVMLFAPGFAPRHALAGEEKGKAQEKKNAVESAADDVTATTGKDTSGSKTAGAKKKKPAASGKEPTLWELLLQGGWLMLPIALMLILAITFTVERCLGLRREKVLPHGLILDFGRRARAAGGFDPRAAYRACQAHPSAAANVIRAMLLKTGRPLAEVEHTVSEASEREAARLYANVRWLNLAAAVSPLMGLLGTVWGMIVAFNATANLPEKASKAEVLADGIVVALVTTLGGLTVAIPAAIAAHFLEGRIQSLFREVDELLFNLLPQIEQYEGQLRVSKTELGAGGPLEDEPLGPLEPAAPPRPGDTAAGTGPPAPPVIGDAAADTGPPGGDGAEAAKHPGKTPDASK